MSQSPPGSGSQPAPALRQQLEAAVALHRGGRLSEALAAYGRIIEADSRNFDAFNLGGLAALQLGGHEVAVQLLEVARGINPGVAATHAYLGAALLGLGRFADALAACDGALSLQRDHFDALLHRGHALAQLGRGEEALLSYEVVLRGQPGHLGALRGRAGTLQGMGRHAEAVAACDAALAVDRGQADLLNNRGVSLLGLGEPGLAVESFSAALALRAQDAQALSNRGAAYLDLDRCAEALADVDEAIRLRPDHLQAHINRGNALNKLRRHEEAVAAFNVALAADPHQVDALYNRSAALRDLRRFEDALLGYDAALRLRPGDADILNNRSVVLLALDRTVQALDDLDALIAAGVARADVWSNRGNVLQRQGRFEEALYSYDESLRLRPRDPTTLVNRSLALQGLGRFAEAIEDCGEANRCQPDHADALFNRALVELLIGDYPSGWRNFEWRWHLPLFRGSGDFVEGVERWTGKQSVESRSLLLRSEQGVGDTLQFCRYAPLAAARGARVVLQVPDSLVRLLRAQDWSAEGTAVSGRSVEVVSTADPLPSFDLHCPLMSLPLAFGTTLETIPYGKEAYLQALPAEVERWRERLRQAFGGEGRPRVGLVWNGGFRPAQSELWHVNERRNVPLGLFAGALDLAGIDFVSLQKGDPAESELRAREGEYWQAGRLLNAAGELNDFADTAGLIAHLDLVISVDTSTAHLAAALGKPVWILNRYDTCWRWLLGREDSPWYGSVRLYRQGADRDWRPVLERVAGDLSKWSKDHPVR